MFPTAAGETEMEEAVAEALAADGDAQIVTDGEVRQPLSADRVMLREDDLLLAPVQRPPPGNPALKGSQWQVSALKAGECVRRLLFVMSAPDSQREISPPSGRKSTYATVRIC